MYDINKDFFGIARIVLESKTACMGIDNCELPRYSIVNTQANSSPGSGAGSMLLPC